MFKYISKIVSLVLVSALVLVFAGCSQSGKYNAKVVGIDKDTVIIQWEDNIYSFYGNGFSLGENIHAVIKNNMVIDAWK